jgi:hypothetical protein
MEKPREVSMDERNMNSASVTTAYAVPVPPLQIVRFVFVTLHLLLKMTVYNTQ